MWTQYQRAIAEGRRLNGADLDRLVGTNNYGRFVLAQWRRLGLLSDSHWTPRPIGGVDWASTDHAVAIVDPDGEQIGRFSVAHNGAGLHNMVAKLLAAGVEEVGIERPDGPSSTPCARPV